MDDLWRCENMGVEMVEGGRGHSLESGTEPFPEHS